MELFNEISQKKIFITAQQTINEVLQVFDTLLFSSVPIVKNKKLVGMVSKEDLSLIEDGEQKIADLEYLYNFYYAKQKDTLLEVISSFVSNNTDVLPIIDDENNYLGFLNLHDTLESFADTDFLKVEGNTLLLQKNTSEYSFSEICQITESQNNRILGCFVLQSNEEKTTIVIKVKSRNINELIQSFRRYSYNILSTSSEDYLVEHLKKHSEYFIKYLNI